MNNQIQKKETKTLKELLTGPDFAEQVARASTKHLTPERLIRVAETTLKRVPKLEKCTPETFFVALLNCSAVGLEPDGQHAHLIPYGTECKLIIDYKGLLAIARRNGVNATSKVVRQNDIFDVIEDDGTGKTAVNHKVDYTKPRGDLVCVYSRAKWAQDGFDFLDYEVMTRDECEAIRDRSKAGSAGPWKTDFDEMCRKTVIRRHSKRWPLSAEAQTQINKDDDVPNFEEKRFQQAKPIFPKPAELPAATEAVEATEEVETTEPETTEAKK